MYSVRHVLWRGAMALSLLVVGGVGAGVSSQPEEQARQGCDDALPIVQRAHATPHFEIDAVVVIAEQPRVPAEA